jgi:hypothetical protein
VLQLYADLCTKYSNYVKLEKAEIILNPEQLSHMFNIFASNCTFFFTPLLFGSGSTLRTWYAISASLFEGNGTVIVLHF